MESSAKIIGRSLIIASKSLLLNLIQCFFQIIFGALKSAGQNSKYLARVFFVESHSICDELLLASKTENDGEQQNKKDFEWTGKEFMVILKLHTRYFLNGFV